MQRMSTQVRVKREEEEEGEKGRRERDMGEKLNCCMYCRLLLLFIYLLFNRFSREEPFTAINVDIRLHHNLFESLDSYVKGDLLEGANAYRCEICNKEVSLLMHF